MKKSELRQMIREEYQRVLNEVTSGKYDDILEEVDNDLTGLIESMYDLTKETKSDPKLSAEVKKMNSAIEIIRKSLKALFKLTEE